MATKELAAPDASHGRRLPLGALRDWAAQTELWRALSEHGRRVWQRWWLIIVSGVGAVLGLITLVVPAPTPAQAPGQPTPAPGPLVPTWVWVPLLAGGVVVAQFLSFYDVRKEREAARTQLRTRLDELRYGLQLQGVNAQPIVAEDDTPGVLFGCTLVNGSTAPMEYEVEVWALRVGDGGVVVPPGTRGLILAGREGQFQVPWWQRTLDEQFEGIVDYSIAYRHPSGRQPTFRIRQKLRVQVAAGEGVAVVRRTALEPIAHEVVEEA